MTNKAVGIWLLATSGAAATVISYGGYTRLKRAGLAMIDWKPHDVRRPTSQNAWQDEFERYKETPDYYQNNPTMELKEFKTLYNIEWFHRVLARGLGVVFAVPLAFFWGTGRLVRGDKRRMLALFGLGGIQASMGWIMVKSGLGEEEQTEGERARVNPYKLAAHKTCGLAIYSILFWNALNHLRGPPSAMAKFPKIRGGVIGVLHLSLTTMIGGAFMAGTDASTVMHNWPFYGQDTWFPSTAWELQPAWRNFFENKGMVQVVHRTLAYFTYLQTLGVWIRARDMALPLSTRWSVNGMLAVATWQVGLGIKTLYGNSKIEDALLHQGSGLAFLTTILFALHTVRRVR